MRKQFEFTQDQLNELGHLVLKLGWHYRDMGIKLENAIQMFDGSDYEAMMATIKERIQ